MTTQSIAPKSFALSTHRGRTHQPLNILGADMLVKLKNEDTDGKVAIFEQKVPPMSGPPLHRHSREEEWFYVLEGQITIQIDGRRAILRTGDSAYASCGTAHTYQNYGPARARTLVVVTPGHFQRFFEELTLLNRSMLAPDLARVEQLMNEYGVELLGPSLP